MSPRVVEEGDLLLVYPTVGRLAEVKSLGALWDSRRRAWRLPAANMNRVALRELLSGVEVPAPVASPPPSQVVDDRLYDYQVREADRLAAATRGEILIMSPGLGKTAVAIAAADAVTTDQVIVVAPAALLRTWAREIKRWGKGDSTTAIVVGKPDWTLVAEARWLVTSWDTFTRHVDWFAGRWPLMILDESVLAKSRASKRFKAIAKFRRNVDRIWLLSGSPTTRHVDDLWTQLSLIWPSAFKSYWRFAERYCVIEDTVWARSVVATRDGRDAVADNSDLISVVNQADVLDLPEYLFEVVDVELEGVQKTAYRSMLKEFIASLPDGDELVAESKIAQLIRLQQIVSFWDGKSAKHDAALSLIKDGVYEKPWLFWTHWRAGATALTDRLVAAGISAVHVDGDMSARAKDDAIEGYKSGTVDALVLSLGVGKFGLTMTNTKTMFYMDRTFSADDYFQSLRRVRRIGLTHRPVVVTLRAPGTTDDLLEANLDGKVTSIARITGSTLRELLNGLGLDPESEMNI